MILGPVMICNVFLSCHCVTYHKHITNGSFVYDSFASAFQSIPSLPSPATKLQLKGVILKLNATTVQQDMIAATILFYRYLVVAAKNQSRGIGEPTQSGRCAFLNLGQTLEYLLLVTPRTQKSKIGVIPQYK